MQTSTEPAPPVPAVGPREAVRAVRLAVVVGALGVVFGDIGTSPIYTIQTVFDPSDPHPVPLSPDNIYGVVSLIFWAVMIIVTLTYVTLVMHADNDGEGGIMALITLCLLYTSLPSTRNRRNTKPRTNRSTNLSTNSQRRPAARCTGFSADGSARRSSPARASGSVTTSSTASSTASEPQRCSAGEDLVLSAGQLVDEPIDEAVQRRPTDRPDDEFR